jgi:hypothetical protein
MAKPIEIDEKKYHLVWSDKLSVTGASVNSKLEPIPHPSIKQTTFHAYIEMYEQSAHDDSLMSKLRERGLQPRSPHPAMVHPPNDGSFDYYRAHGRIASQLAAQEMTDRWNAKAGNSNVFTRNAHVLAKQGVEQENGFYYETTMYYDVRDVYVTFHCYQKRTKRSKKR